MVSGCLFDAGFFFFFCGSGSDVFLRAESYFACYELNPCDSFPRVFDVWSRDMVVMVRWW